MINIVMLIKNRPRLTEQALTTLIANTDVPWNLTVIEDDGNAAPDVWQTSATVKILTEHPNVAYLINARSKGITGQVRNLGVYWSEKYFGRGDWLVLCDNDVAFFPHWANSLSWEIGRGGNEVKLLGGCRHPFHAVNGRIRQRSDGTLIEETDAVAGYLQMMLWNTWDEYGPLDAHAVGTGQSEDYAFCRKIVAAGGKVGYIHPPVCAHCGITNTDGSPAIGAEKIERLPGLIYE